MNELLCSVFVEPETTLPTGGIPLDDSAPKLDAPALDVNGIEVVWASEGSKLNNEVVEKLVLNPDEKRAEKDAKLDS